MRWPRRLVAPGVMALVLWLAAWPQRPPDPLPVTLSAAHWTAVSLPATPLGVNARGKDLWVCGWDAMVAESTDGGRVWRVRHIKPNGEPLFTLAFAGREDVFVFGAVRAGFASRNGGTSWQNSGGADFAVNRAYFAGPRSGLLAGPKGFAFGRPGAWRARTARNLADLGSAALLDARDALVLMDISAPGQSRVQTWVLHTTDGGRHWPGGRLTAIEPLSAAAANGRYWMVALGPKAKPMLLASGDGARWSVVGGVRRTGRHCNRRGCRDGAGWRPFADISSFTAPWVYPLPPDPDTYASWAAAGNVVCDVGGTLRCALAGARRADPVGPRPRPRSGAKDNVRAARCLRCAPPGYPIDARAQGVQGTVVMHAMIGKHGRVHDLMLLAAPDRALAKAAMETVAHWRYRPALLNGRPVTVETTITVNFTLQR
ncbi:MAG: TonB family protein [Terriglobales bacterium]